MVGLWLFQLVKKMISPKKKQIMETALQTVLCKGEAILNDRSSTTVSNGPNDLEHLTPNPLLSLRASQQCYLD